MEEKKTYLRKMAERLEQLDATVAELKAKAAKTGEETKAEFDKKVADLNAKQQEVLQRLRELKEAGAEKWDSLKGRAEKAQHNLEEAVGKIVAKFKK
jgi:DNA-binding ferritin-like protein